MNALTRAAGVGNAGARSGRGSTQPLHRQPRAGGPGADYALIERIGRGVEPGARLDDRADLRRNLDRDAPLQALPGAGVQAEREDRARPLRASLRVAVDAVAHGAALRLELGGAEQFQHEEPPLVARLALDAVEAADAG